MGRRLPGLAAAKLGRACRRRIHRLDPPGPGRGGRPRLRRRLADLPRPPAPRQTIHPGPQNDTRLALLDFLTSVRAEKPLPPPITLAEAKNATLTGLLVRKAVDERRECDDGRDSLLRPPRFEIGTLRLSEVSTRRPTMATVVEPRLQDKAVQASLPPLENGDRLTRA